MQATAKSDSGQATVADDTESEYVGKHRPHRMALLRPRVRVGQLSDRSHPRSSK